MKRSACVRALLAALMTVTGLVVAAPAGAASPVVERSSTTADPFYVPPKPLPRGRPGDLIRSATATQALPLPLIGPAAAGTRLMYLTTASNGKLAAVTGLLLEPRARWQGGGKRPIVGFAVGTHGQGDTCAPSVLLDKFVDTDLSHPMLAYEAPAMAALLARGIAVVVTDYLGLGTPAVHTYLNRADEGHALLDAVRAAQRLPGTALPKNGPVGLWGYSQGGQAASSAAEIARKYAPELDIRGTYAGAGPADMKALMRRLDGTSLTGVLFYVLNGFEAAYPRTRPAIRRMMNERGRVAMAASLDQCVPMTLFTYMFQKSSAYTTSGRPLLDVLRSEKVTRRAVKRQKIGRRTPNAPILLTGGDNDDIVPFAVTKRLAGKWCDRGVSVRLRVEPLPPLAPGTAGGHLLNQQTSIYLEALRWMQDRFQGKPNRSTC